MKLGALPIACQQAPGITEIPVFPKRMKLKILSVTPKFYLGWQTSVQTKVLPGMKILQKNKMLVFSIFSIRKSPQELHINMEIHDNLPMIN